jgi:hypothetical protein
LCPTPPIILAIAAATALAAAIGTACGPRLGREAADGRAESARVAAFRNARLQESSGVVASRLHPGLLWTHNDSGDAPELFATDTAGTDLGSVIVSGAENVDWEDVALGPCGDETGDQRCLWIADTGDNRHQRSAATIYRVREPERPPAQGGPRRTRPAERLVVRYPDGAHDVEALAVTDAGDALLITKGEQARVYRVPAAAWRRGTAVAEPLGPLTLAGGAALGRLVTGAAMGPDRRVAVRTYRDLYVFTLAPDGRLRPLPGGHLDIAGLEMQGEGVDWLDRHTFVLTSERSFAQAGTVAVVPCPPSICGVP